MLTHEAVARIATDVLTTILGDFGFEQVVIKDDVESDGDPALLVLARFKAGSKPADGSATLTALAQLREQLRNAGDERFPLLRFEFPDDQIPYATDEDMQAWQ